MITIPQIEESLNALRDQNEKLQKQLFSAHEDIAELREQLGVSPLPRPVQPPAYGGEPAANILRSPRGY